MMRKLIEIRNLRSLVKSKHLKIEPDYVVYSQKVGFFESLAGVMHGSAFELGRGIAFQLESDKPYYLTLNN